MRPSTRLLYVLAWIGFALCPWYLAEGLRLTSLAMN